MNTGETVRITRCLYPESCRFHGSHIGQVTWKGKLAEKVERPVGPDQQGYCVIVPDALVQEKRVWAIDVTTSLEKAPR